MKTTISVRTVTTCAMLVAIEVILSRFLSISTPIIKIGFDFAPMALAGILFGPFWGCVVGMSADFIGAVLFPIDAYFFGFTATAGLVGLTYGALLHRPQGGVYGGNELRLRTLIAVFIVVIPLQFMLNTYWLSILTGKAFWAYIPPRAIKQILFFPIQYVTIGLLVRWASRMIKDRSFA